MELTPEGASVPGSLVIGGFDGATVRVGPSADVTVLTGVTSPGSGNETAMAQIAADVLGTDIARVNVIQGDTDTCPWGLGNYSSRSVIMGGSAVHEAATTLRRRILEVAGQMLEVAAGDLDIVEGRVVVRGSPRSAIALEEVVKQFYRHPHGAPMEGVEPSLEATSHFRIDNVWHQPETQGRLSTYPTWPYAAVACVVEVDRETGCVEILRCVYVHDAGTLVNPLLVDANLHGAISQGIGGALYEEIAYASDGAPRTLSFGDYTIPTALDLPTYELAHESTPSPYTPLGAKGVGESGVGGCLNALASAVEDALPDLDLQLGRLPLTPAALWHAMATAERRADPAGRAAG
jgi:carbon-monoxide dehydrogenase large subunit